jgi:hypothetical protein
MEDQLANEDKLYDFPEDTIPERYEKAVSLDQQQVRTLDKKHLFLIAYEKTGGNVTISCQMAGVESRKTFYNWYETDKAFREAIESTHEARRDLVEDIMMVKIMKNHGPTIRYWLSKHHPDYKKKRLPKVIGPNAPHNPFKKYLS